MYRHRSAPEKVESPREVEQGRELSEPVALPLRRDRRELVADVIGQRHAYES
jgi:hypothetical protein